MTDATEEGPDPNGVRRHAKKMLTEREYRLKYCRIDFYRPNAKQLEFHNTVARERMLRAGNQIGKTFAGAAQMTMDALRLYPDWYKGRRFDVPPPVERPMAFLGWAACTTSTTTRDGVQTKLLGNIRDEGGLGTGLIPLDNIVGKPSMARGIQDFVDTITLRREGGGMSMIRFKTYQMGREAFQGEPVDEIWLDEDPGDDDDIYSECWARLTGTRGNVISTMTPVIGLTPLRKRFKEGGHRVEILMTIDDAIAGGYLTQEQIDEQAAGYKEHEKQTRLYGADMQGEGAVFTTPVESIKHRMDPTTFPPYWTWLWGLDFRHSGAGDSGHPFAAVLGAWDRDNDVIYVVEALRMRGLALNHVHRIKQSRWALAPVAWPHDGGRGAGIVSGETVAATYRKLGLNMLARHATFPGPDGGYNFENGITLMEERFETGRLLIAAHLAEVFDEYQGYHRKDGLVVKVDDDLMSAIRVLCMDIRYAKPWGKFNVPRSAAGAGAGGIGSFAIGSLGHPEGVPDIFTGQ